MKSDIKTRASFGVACCRVRDGRPEIILICKRYTYAFNDFVHGAYASSSDAEILALLGRMTIDEKYDILSLNFSQIWYRVWLSAHKRTAFYFTAKNKYESAFVHDGGARIRRLAARSGHSDRIWEIPKGRRHGRYEHPLQCALREFEEETGVSKKKYRLIPGATRVVSHVDENIKYTSTYYIGWARGDVGINIDRGLIGGANEIFDTRWADIEAIRRLDPSGRLARIVRPIFHTVKKYLRIIDYRE